MCHHGTAFRADLTTTRPDGDGVRQRKRTLRQEALRKASVPEQMEVVVLAEAERILHRPPERFVGAVPLGW